MNLSVGFIGAGNMGFAMIKSMVDSSFLPALKINVFDTDKLKTESLGKSLKVNVLSSIEEVAEKSDIIIIAVKPNVVAQVTESIKHVLSCEKIFVSIAVGIPIKFYSSILGDDKKIVRVMPNTPALVGEGMSLISYNKNLAKNDISNIVDLFNCFGKAETLDEKLMNEVTALTGSSPAYVYIFIEAMADAAVLSGIPRKFAYTLAAQTVLGSAKMVLETGIHPGELKDQVCSPGGTTIEAVAALEKNGFRYAVIDAMNECTKKACAISKKFD